MMSKQVAKDWTVPLVIILGGCLLFGLLWYFVHGLVESIEQVGLKAIWDQLWCGKQGCI